MFDKIKHLEVSRRLIYFLTERSEGMEEEMLDEAFTKTEIYPNKKTATQFLDKFILAIGMVFMVCGVIFFFAYNWADLHKFAKLGIVMAILLGTGIFTALQEADGYMRKIGLAALCGLTGALFALFGQIYQTGANAYDFFLGWTALVTAWVLISRSSALWVFYMVLVNTTAILFAGQVHRLWGTPFVMLLLLLFNLACWALWEFLSHSNRLFTKSRTFPRLVGMASIFLITVIAQDSIFGASYSFRGEDYTSVYILNWVILVAVHALVLLLVYRKIIKDLFFLGLSIVGLIWIGTGLFVELSSFRDAGAFLLLSALLIAITFFAVKWLIGVNRAWREEEANLAESASAQEE